MNEIPTAWPRIGVMGGGAVGCYYGGLLARAGARVTIVARPRHVDAIRANGLRVTSRDFDFTRKLEASTDVAALRESELLLFCTKTRDTEAAAHELGRHLPGASIVLAFQNGVDGAERLAAILTNPVFAAALFVSCQMQGPGHVRHNGRGDLLLGDVFKQRPDAAERRARLESLARVFQRASIPAGVADDIRHTLWTKLAMNAAYNALSALGRARYARLAGSESSRSLIRQIVAELVAVASADGVALDLEAVLGQVLSLGDSMPNAISSTGQDIAAGRRTEIDDLNGYVVRRGRAKGIATPVNETLQRLIQVLEEAPVDQALWRASAGS